MAVEAARVESELTVPASLVSALPERLRTGQAAFEATGGLHATGLFSADGELLCIREDVGRHNALDKVIGRAFLDGRLPLSGAILCVSGRLSFELVQKAAVAGCPLLVAVGAPSSLAIELAADRGITLCGFVRGGSLNVYTEPWRIERLTGVLLVGGARRGSGSPKALARLRGETLAERAWRTLGEACDERIAVGKGDLALPFEVLVEPAEPQAPIAGVVAGLRAAAHETAVFLPVDCPLVTPQLLRELGEHAAVPQTGPLPGAYTKHDLPELERRLATGDYTLRGVNLRVREVDVRLLADVDSPDALSALEEHLAALDDHRA